MTYKELTKKTLNDILSVEIYVESLRLRLEEVLFLLCEENAKAYALEMVGEDIEIELFTEEIADQGSQSVSFFLHGQTICQGINLAKREIRERINKS